MISTGSHKGSIGHVEIQIHHHRRRDEDDVGGEGSGSKTQSITGTSQCIGVSDCEFGVSIETGAWPCFQTYREQWLLVDESSDPCVATYKFIGIGVVIAFQGGIEIP